MATLATTKVVARPEMGKGIYDAYALNKYDEYELIGYVVADSERKALNLASKKAASIGKIDMPLLGRVKKNLDREKTYSRFNL